MNNRNFCKKITIDEIPWNKIVGCYDRATNFPSLLTKLDSKNTIERQNALKEISLNIEHQSTLYTITPLTFIFLFKHLSNVKENDDNNKIEFVLKILDLILRILNIAKLNINNIKFESLKIENLKGILAEEYLWEEFQSEEKDEINWEENLCSEDYYISINTNIIDISKINYSIIKNISSMENYKEKGNEIRSLINTFNLKTTNNYFW